MPDTLTILPLTTPLRATLRPPGSKSLTNRALLLAALADGVSTLTGVLEADDPHYMRQALGALGFALEHDPQRQTVSIAGQGGRLPRSSAELFLGNAGTAVRFLTAAVCLGDGEYTLDGVPRMRQRPLAQLVEPLRQLGARIDYLGDANCPPLRVRAGGLRGGELTMPPTLSSQYISALLQVGPYCQEGLTLQFDGPVTSRPYVEMTLNVMERFGVTCEVDPAFTCVHVPRGGYVAQQYDIEPDASAASYFLALGALLPEAKVTVQGLGFRSVQGDTGFAMLLQQMGAGVICERDAITVLGLSKGEKLRGIDVDLNHMPDMAQTLAVVALFAEGPTVIRNIGNLRVKETDRMAALRNELTKLGAQVDIAGDDMTITPPVGGQLQVQPGTVIATYDDHRMAMSFAVAGLAAPELTDGLTLADPACVNKTFPDYFEYLDRLRQAADRP